MKRKTKRKNITMNEVKLIDDIVKEVKMLKKLEKEIHNITNKSDKIIDKIVGMNAKKCRTEKCLEKYLQLLKLKEKEINNNKQLKALSKKQDKLRNEFNKHLLKLQKLISKVDAYFSKLSITRMYIVYQKLKNSKAFNNRIALEKMIKKFS